MYKKMQVLYYRTTGKHLTPFENEPWSLHADGHNNVTVRGEGAPTTEQINAVTDEEVAAYRIEMLAPHHALSDTVTDLLDMFGIPTGTPREDILLTVYAAWQADNAMGPHAMMLMMMSDEASKKGLTDDDIKACRGRGRGL